MSTCVRKHATHVLAGLGSIGVPHWQQRLGIQGEERERGRERGGVAEKESRVSNNRRMLIKVNDTHIVI